MLITWKRAVYGGYLGTCKGDKQASFGAYKTKIYNGVKYKDGWALFRLKPDGSKKAQLGEFDTLTLAKDVASKS